MLFLVVGSAGFVAFKNESVIRRRTDALVFLSATCAFILIVDITSQLVSDRVDSPIEIMCRYFLVLLTVNMTVARVFRLILSHQVTAARLLLAKPPDQNATVHRTRLPILFCFRVKTLKLSKWVNPKPLFWVALSLSTVQGLVGGIASMLSLVGDSDFEPTKLETYQQVDFIFTILSSLSIFSVLSAIVSWNVYTRGKPDNYWLRIEFTTTGASSLVGFVSWATTKSIDRFSTQITNPTLILSFFLLNHLFISIVCPCIVAAWRVAMARAHVTVIAPDTSIDTESQQAIPLASLATVRAWRSGLNPDRNRAVSGAAPTPKSPRMIFSKKCGFESVDSLNACLEDPEAFLSFQAFLVREFAVENLFWWLLAVILTIWPVMLRWTMTL
eukprot:GABV01008575.1.p1 GENE.GABV01008575.1~~GABV01008575.1.p1  ORF type:complete len:386 (+),score=106.30 GABV01008575.1:207-1364(+)